jgi:hypothetical protein
MTQGLSNFAVQRTRDLPRSGLLATQEPVDGSVQLVVFR